MNISFGTYVLIILNPDAETMDAVNEGISHFYKERWTKQALKGLYGWMCAKGYSVLIQDRQNNIYSLDRPLENTDLIFLG